MSRNPTKQRGASTGPVSKRHKENLSQTRCTATTLAIAKGELQTIPWQDEKNRQNKIHKRDYHAFLDDSIRKYNLDNGVDLHIENVMMNILMGILFRSQIPIHRLRSLQPMIYGTEEGKNSGKDGNLLAFRLPFQSSEQDRSKFLLETLQGEDTPFWGLCGAQVAPMGDMISGGLTKGAPLCSDGKWCWGLGCIDPPTQMMTVLEAFKNEYGHGNNVVNVGVEVLIRGVPRRGPVPDEPPSVDVADRFVYRSRNTRNKLLTFSPTDAVITGLIFFNATAEEMPFWDSILYFDEPE